MNIKDKSLGILIIILVLHGFILTKLIFFPYPELFIYPYLTNAGLIPYHQILDQHFPGLLFLPINLNNLGMVNEVVARWWLIGVVLLIQIELFWVSRIIFKSSRKALLVNFSYLLWQPFLEGWVLWIDTFLPFFLIPSLGLLYLRKSYFLTGILLGLAVLFKQAVIPLVGLITIFIFLTEKNKRLVLTFVSGLLPIPFLMLSYFYTLGVIKDFWFWTVTFNLTTFAKFGTQQPTISGLVRVFFIYSPIIISFLIKDRRLLALLLIFTLGNLSGDFARFDFVHFQVSLPFVSLLGVLILVRLSKTTLGRVITMLYLLVTATLLVTFYKGHIGERVLFFGQDIQSVTSRIEDYTEPGDEIFLLGVPPHLYQMTQTIPAGRIFVFQFPWFLMESKGRFLDALITSKPRLIVRDESVVIDDIPITVFAQDINNYINQHYVVFDKIDKTQFLKIKDE